MGFVYPLRKYFHDAAYLALASGLCGSLTTFSSWNHDMAYTLWIAESFGISLLGWIEGLAASLHALCLGAALAAVVEPLFRGRKGSEPLGRWLPVVLVAAALLTTLITLLIDADMALPWVLAALIFGPIGAIVRYALAKRLNPALPSFKGETGQYKVLWPFPGTLLANALGALVACFCYLMEQAADADGNTVLAALSIGLGGCLSTVSRFALEGGLLAATGAFRVVMNGEGDTAGWNRVKAAFGYTFLTIFLAQVIALPLVLPTK